MNFSQDLIVGVLSGIIISILSALTIKLWDIIIMPLLQKYFNKNVLLDGDWIGTGKDEFGEFKLKVKVQQRGNNIFGKIDRVQNNVVEMKFEFNGIFRNSIINVIYTEEKNIKNRFDMGNLIGKVELGGARITGIFSYLSNANNDEFVTCKNLSFIRVQNEGLYDAGLNIKNK